MVSVVVFSEDDAFVEQIKRASGYMIVEKYSDAEKRGFDRSLEYIFVIDAMSDSFSISIFKSIDFKAIYKILVTQLENQDLVSRLADEVSDVWYSPLNPHILQKRISSAQIIMNANRHIAEHMSYACMETKNPIASVKGYADVMLAGMTGELSEQQRNFLQIIRTNAVRIGNIIDDLRDEAKIRANQFYLNLEIVDLHQIFDSYKPDPDLISIQNPQNIEVTLQKSLPGVLADQYRLIQIFNLLIENAYDSLRIVINISHDQKAIHFQVTDFGQRNYHRNQNNPENFYLVNSHSQIIIEHIIKAHGGKMWLEQDNDSSTFHFTIPIAKENDSDD